MGDKKGARESLMKYNEIQAAKKTYFGKENEIT